MMEKKPDATNGKDDKDDGGDKSGSQPHLVLY
jgi:hypothetical protein